MSSAHCMNSYIRDTFVCETMHDSEISPRYSPRRLSSSMARMFSAVRSKDPLPRRAS